MQHLACDRQPQRNGCLPEVTPLEARKVGPPRAPGGCSSRRIQPHARCASTDADPLAMGLIQLCASTPFGKPTCRRLPRIAVLHCQAAPFTAAVISSSREWATRVLVGPRLRVEPHHSHPTALPVISGQRMVTDRHRHRPTKDARHRRARAPHRPGAAREVTRFAMRTAAEQRVVPRWYSSTPASVRTTSASGDANHTRHAAAGAGSPLPSRRERGHSTSTMPRRWRGRRERFGAGYGWPPGIASGQREGRTPQLYRRFPHHTATALIAGRSRELGGADDEFHMVGMVALRH